MANRTVLLAMWPFRAGDVDVAEHETPQAPQASLVRFLECHLRLRLGGSRFKVTHGRPPRGIGTSTPRGDKNKCAPLAAKVHSCNERV